jgi:hypothetical protein
LTAEVAEDAEEKDERLSGRQKNRKLRVLGSLLRKGLGGSKDLD